MKKYHRNKFRFRDETIKFLNKEFNRIYEIETLYYPACDCEFCLGFDWVEELENFMKRTKGPYSQVD